MSQIEKGDLVVLTAGDLDGVAGIVSSASGGGSAHVVVLHDGRVRGLTVDTGNLAVADSEVGGWAQLAHELVSLGSRIIEQRLLVYR